MFGALVAADTSVAVIDATGVVTGIKEGNTTITGKRHHHELQRCGLGHVRRHRVHIGHALGLSDVCRGFVARGLLGRARMDDARKWILERRARMVRAAGVSVLLATEGCGSEATVCLSLPYVEPSCANLVVSPAFGTVCAGQTKTFVATSVGEGTSKAPTVEWESSDPTIATIGSAGTLSARGPGSVVVTATCSNGRAATAKVTVITCADAGADDAGSDSSVSDGDVSDVGGPG